MLELDELRNRGVLRLGRAPEAQKTIVVLGVARSGTSMVTSVLRALGIFLGDRAQAPVFEDVRLATALEAGVESEVRAILNEYDDAHSVWAFKRPGLIDQLEQAHSLFRNPAYVVVFRDMLSIANRNALSMKSDPMRSMEHALRQYEKLLAFLRAANPSALLFSNEKALLNPAGFVDELVRWLGLEVGAQEKRAAVGTIIVDDPEYLDKSRLQFLGCLDRATTEAISGWAFIRGRKGFADLNIHAAGRLIGSVTADRHRPDVRKNGVHPTGFCGFHFEFEAHHGIAPGDEVEIRFAYGGDLLRGCPHELAPSARLETEASAKS